MKKSLWKIPKEKQIRVIIDTDAACEGDDQYAIVHALLTPKCDISGILAVHYGSQNGVDSMEESYQEIQRILNFFPNTKTAAYRGAKTALNADGKENETEASKFLISECRKADERPLFILCQGALTNVAEALTQAPDIADKAICVTVGGCNYPAGGFEFNYYNDIAAADVVMGSKMEVWQIPEEVYSTMQVGFSELYEKVYPCGEIGKYLTMHLSEVQEQLMNRIPKLPWMKSHEYALGFPNGESWSLGDSCAIGLLLAASVGAYLYEPAPVILAGGQYAFHEERRKIRIYKNINSRFILEDFFAKMKYCKD